MSRPPPWQPSSADYRRIFAEQNPWHTTGRVPSSLAFDVERPLTVQLWRSLGGARLRRYQLVLGPRRVGKTVCMYQTVRHLLAGGIEPRRLWWLHMAHPLLMNVRLDELLRTIVEQEAATPENPAYVFVDELTYADQWDLWLKEFYDQRWPIRLMGTSSSTAALRHGRSESGVGRWDEQYLSPYLFDEFLDLVQKPRRIEPRSTLASTLKTIAWPMEDGVELAGLRQRYLLVGGFPELLLGRPLASELDPATLLLESQRVLGSDAVERVIYKDIPQVFSIDSPLVLERLLYTLAGQVTGVLSPSSICRELDGISQPTFDKYLSYLERSFLVFTLSNYAQTEAGKQKRGRKLFFVDGAVRNASLRRGLGPLHDTAEMGLLLENLVASHLHAVSQQSQVRIYYWRRGRDEVDLVYDHPSEPLAFEIASSVTHSRHGLHAFRRAFRRFERACYLVAPDAPTCWPEDSTDGVGSLPLDLLLLALGAQARADLTQRLGGPTTLFSA